MTDSILVTRKRLETAIDQKLTQSGASMEEAAIVAKHLVSAESRGRASHGIRRLPRLVEELQQRHSAPTPKFGHSVGKSVRTYDADGQLGIVAMTSAAELSKTLAQEYGISAVSVTNYRGTTGELGAYTHEVSKSGATICMAFAGSEYAVAPYGSRRAILGTNPIAISFPAEDSVFTADLATAAWSYGKIMEASRRGEPVPLGVVQDADGNPSVDPEDANNGSQLALGGAKGYALCLAVELLCGPLIGGKAGRDAVAGSDGSLIVSIWAESFTEGREVRRDASLLFREILEAPAAQGHSGARIPGTALSAPLPEEVTLERAALRAAGIEL